MAGVVVGADRLLPGVLEAEGCAARLCAHRWDRDPLARAVTKLVSNDKKETLASAPTLQKALALMTDTAQQEHHVHPHHIMLPLDADAKSILGEFPKAFSAPLPLCFSLAFPDGYHITPMTGMGVTHW